MLIAIAFQFSMQQFEINVPKFVTGKNLKESNNGANSCAIFLIPTYSRLSSTASLIETTVGFFLVEGNHSPLEIRLCWGSR
jgi:hypothetical protein